MSKTGVAVRRREQGPAVPARRFEWPTYLVTAPHVSLASPGGQPRMPYGTWHAREVGSPRTVCGLPALTWHFFWTLRFERGGSRACRECAHALAAAAR